MPTRREFLVAAAAGTMVAGRMERRARTIQEIINICKEVAPDVSQDSTVDTVKFGDPTQEIRGVATTFLATNEVIWEAARSGCNLLITHEPTFYNHFDETNWLADDPVYLAKRKLLEDFGMVVWRFHDHWHARTPDGIAVGVLKHLGWEAYARPDNPRICDIAPTPLSSLSVFMKRRFGAQRVRVMGAPDMLCSKVGLVVGAAGGNTQIAMLKEVDALVVGEVREWETTEYVRDAVYANKSHGLIAVGHALSEEPGMKYLAEWLKPRVPEARVRFIPTGDPFRYV